MVDHELFDEGQMSGPMVSLMAALEELLVVNRARFDYFSPSDAVYLLDRLNEAGADVVMRDLTKRQAMVRVQGFLRESQRFPDWEPMWVSGGRELRWGDLRLIADQPQQQPSVPPAVVTLCGSTRFKDAYREAERRLAMEGVIVLSCGVFSHADGEELTSRDKLVLDDLHARKIDMSDSILVLNVGGYIGESTLQEIRYATSRGISVEYLEAASSA